jgi:hypothetical protein
MPGNTFTLSTIAVALLSSALARPAQATEVSLEVRQTLVQPKNTPGSVLAPTGTLALTVTEHVWLGVGYELVQNHDAVLWSSDLRGDRPISLSAIRVGAWYRGGEGRHALTYAIGPLLTYANAAISLDASPSALNTHRNTDTYFLDAGADLSIGYVGRRGRVEVFMTPAWSYGRVVSPDVGKSERHSAFEARIGVAFALMVGS